MMSKIISIFKSHPEEKQFWNILQDFNLDESQATKIFGMDWKTLRATREIFSRLVSNTKNNDYFTQLTKYEILIFSQILTRIFKQLDNIPENSILPLDYPTSKKQFDEAISNARNFYENYCRKKNDNAYRQKNYEQNQYYQNYSNSSQRKRYNSVKETRIAQRLAKFQITEYEAQKIFGKRWYSPLSKPDWKLFFDLWKIEIKIEFSDTYRKKLGSLLQKTLKIIEDFDRENPELARQKRDAYRESYQNYSEESYTFSSSYDSGILNNAYSILNVNEDSTLEEIKENYRQLSLKYHPDRNNSADSTEMMAKINNAYEVIMEVRLGSKK